MFVAGRRRTRERADNAHFAVSGNRLSSTGRGARTGAGFRLTRVRACERGSVLVEAALIVPILMALVVGMFELTRVITDYHSIDKGVRAGARYLARVPASALSTWGIERARCVATRGVAASDASCNTAGSCILSDWCDAAARATITVIIVEPAPPTTTQRRIRLVANATLDSPLLTLFNRSGTLNVRVEHEEPFIGE
jgi:Flp pilus assembly protein TadG